MTLEEIYDRFGEKMYRYLAMRLGSTEDAEDVLQQTFCRLARYSVRRAFVRNPQAFVFTAARNEANRFLARQKGRRSRDLESAAREGAIPAFAAAQDPDASTASIARALAGLPDEQKEAVILKVYQGLSFREIADVCSVSVNTAASRYRYGLEKLRAALEGKR
jgi:RNA polymerase sigma-70 factor (ECF subfamily)